MTKLKNTSFTLFRWQEYIWRPGEVIVFNENGLNTWEDSLAYQLSQQHTNLVIIPNDELMAELVEKVPEKSKRELLLARLEKARAARKANREKSNQGT